MKYKVLISENPIPDYATVEKLNALGLSVPYVTSDPEFNIYAYQPEDLDLRMSEVKAIHYFEDTELYITERELNHHQDKIKDFNSVEKGDPVKIAGYRNLVTTVEKVDGEEVTSKINLRGYIFRFIESVNKVSKSEVVYKGKELTFNKTFDKNLIVDLSEYKDIDDVHKYVTSVFNLCLRLKLSFPKSNLILVRPLHRVDDLFSITGLLGSFSLSYLIESAMKPDDILYTPDLSLYNKTTNICSKVRNKNIKSIKLLTDQVFKEVTGLDTGLQYRHYLNLQKAYGKTKLIFQEDYIKKLLLQDESNLKDKFPEAFDVPVINKDIVKESYTLNVEDLYNKLYKLGYINIVENLDYYMSIIKG